MYSLFHLQSQSANGGLAGKPEEEVRENLHTLCSVSKYKNSCQLLAESLGLPEKARTPGPGGCLTPQSCRNFCDNPANYSECKQYNIAGPNGCFSELSCYDSCKNGGCTDTTVAPKLQAKTVEEGVRIVTNKLERCSALVNLFQGKRTTEFLTILEKEGCSVFPKNGEETGKKTCTNYLDQSIAKTVSAPEFEQACAILPKVPTLVTPENRQELSCDILSVLSKQNPLYADTAKKCEELSQKFQTTRKDCIKGIGNGTIQSEDDYLRYCLSTPKSMTQYKSYCETQTERCTKNGFEEYCTANPSQCQPLYEGKPLTVVSDINFSDGVNAIHSLKALNATNALNAVNALNAIQGLSETSKVTPNPSRKIVPQPLFQKTTQDTNTSWNMRPPLSPTQAKPNITIKPGQPQPSRATGTNPPTYLLRRVLEIKQAIANGTPKEQFEAELLQIRKQITPYPELLRYLNEQLSDPSVTLPTTKTMVTTPTRYPTTSILKTPYPTQSYQTNSTIPTPYPNPSYQTQTGATAPTPTHMPTVQGTTTALPLWEILLDILF